MERDDPSGGDPDREGRPAPPGDDRPTVDHTGGSPDRRPSVDPRSAWAEESGDESPGSVAGNMDRDRPVVAERIDPENALFVLLGAAVTLLVFVRFLVG